MLTPQGSLSNRWFFTPMKAGASVPDAGNRAASGKGFPTVFRGVATNGEDSVAYSGTRTGSTVRGTLRGGGTVVWAINRSGPVTGSYHELYEGGMQPGTPTFGPATASSATVISQTSSPATRSSWGRCPDRGSVTTGQPSEDPNSRST